MGQHAEQFSVQYAGQPPAERQTGEQAGQAGGEWGGEWGEQTSEQWCKQWGIWVDDQRSAGQQEGDRQLDGQRRLEEEGESPP